MSNKTDRRNFELSGVAAGRFKTLRALLREAAHPTLSSSHLVELLIWHWMEHPPDSREVLDFEFQTKLGRPRNYGANGKKNLGESS